MTTLDLAGGVEEVRARLAERFPGWSIVVTDRGNWWATRATLVREDLNPNDVSTFEAATAEELYERLREVPR
ncbi:hypothetical protein [Actinomadura madurae]|uniref:Uncharacterized protein n=1 Tax=Actinomadura madurae TaxID=1993 RepID=A0A1I5L1C9_9ACTN|nr:hypothetical protein [Actinomadura madurae]SFO91140.1 hypothetical protein SAMN04489713_110214 [Actinomadura madurae]SPT49366.1 Uncharacterised protein [Actinomadura madurae]